MGEDGDPADQELLLRTGRCWEFKVGQESSEGILEGTRSLVYLLLPLFDTAILGGGLKVSAELCSSPHPSQVMPPLAGATCGEASFTCLLLLSLPYRVLGQGP